MKLFGEELADVLNIASNKKINLPNKKLLHEYLVWERSTQAGHLYHHQLTKIREKGWDRISTPQELISLVVDYTEEGKRCSVLDDMYTNDWEFTNSFLQREDDREKGIFNLHIYEGVKFTEYNGLNYVKPEGDDWYENEKIIKYGSLNVTLMSFESLHSITPEIFDYFFDRPYHQVPSSLVEGSWTNGFEVPPDYELYPICVGFGEYDIFKS